MRSGNTVFLSGQIPLDPATGQLVEGDIAAQSRRVFDNLQAVCEAAGGSLDDVVRLGIYLTDLGDFARGQRGDGRILQRALSGALDHRGRRACRAARGSRWTPSSRSTEWFVAPSQRAAGLGRCATHRRRAAGQRCRASVRALAEKLAARGLLTLQDLWLHLPLRYEDRTRI